MAERMDNELFSPTQHRLLVFSSLFPSAAAPTAGTFIRERMFRVAQRLPLVIVAPQPWSPLDWLVRLFRRSFRPSAAVYEVMDGIPVYRPRYVSVPGIMKRLDGRLMAAGAWPVVRRIQQDFRPTLVDAHFLYPDGYAATLLAKRLSVPVTITIRGSKDEWLIGTSREPFLRKALERATKLFAVSEALKRDVAVRLGQPAAKVAVIGNGVDLARFSRVDRSEARARLGIDAAARVVIGVGALNERKGFHRVIPLLPALRVTVPNLLYLIVGGGTTQADLRGSLEKLAKEHGVEDIVRFCGPQPQDKLKWYFGASDVFALATAHEGWANVFLEAMACGLPVITTDVGGNAEVVRGPEYGTLVPYWDPVGFSAALLEALQRSWDSDRIAGFAAGNEWTQRIDQLLAEFAGIGIPAARNG